MIYIYYAKIKENHNINIEIFPDIIKKHLQNKKNKQSYNSSIFTWYCLDLIFKKHYHKSMKELDIYFNENGKPVTKSFYFSISHTIDLCVIAISDRQIGVDVEKIRKIENLENKIEKLFCYLPLNGNDLLTNFFIGFTQYEASIKYEGGKMNYPQQKLTIQNDIETTTIEYDKCLYVISYKGIGKAQIQEITI